MKHAPWLIVGLVLIGAWWSVAGARDAALREQGRVEELTRLREIAEDEAAEARITATQMADSVVMARMRTDSVRSEARQGVVASRRSAEEASGRLRALLDSLAAPVGDLVALNEAHAQEIAAKDTVIVTQEREIVRLRSYAETLVLALDAADERSLAIAAERDSYRKQAELWQKAANPSLFKRATGLVVAVGVGYLAGRL